MNIHFKYDKTDKNDILSMDRIYKALIHALNLDKTELLELFNYSFVEMTLSGMISDKILKKIISKGTTHNRVVFYGNKKQGNISCYAYPDLGNRIEMLARSQKLIHPLADSIKRTFIKPLHNMFADRSANYEYESFMLDFFEQVLSNLRVIITDENTFFAEIKVQLLSLMENIEETEQINQKESYFTELIGWMTAIALLQEKSNILFDHNVNSSINSTMRIKSNYVICDSDIIGRTEDMKKIHELLENNRIVFISSMGGYGKTQVAHKYIYTYRDAYDTVIFAKFENSLKDLIINDNCFHIEGVSQMPDETDESYIHRKLDKISRTSNRLLIVIDNYDTKSDPFFRNLTGLPCRILFTTRTDFSQIIRHSSYKQYNLNSLCMDEQITLFELNYERTIHEADKRKLQKILEHISGHTLTIILIARVMQSQRITFANMLEKLITNGISPNLDGKVYLDSEEAKTVYQHIYTLMRLDHLEEDEIAVMQRLSLLPLSGVPFSEFISWCEKNYTDITNELIHRHWIEKDIRTDSIRLHTIVGDLMRNGMHNPFVQCQDMLDTLSSKFARNWDNMNAVQRFQYGEYAKSLYHRLPENIKDNFLLYRHIGIIFKNLNYFSSQNQLLSKIHAAIGDEDSVELAWYYFDMSEICEHLLDKSNAYHLKSIEIIRRVAPNSYDLSFLAKDYAWMLHEEFRRYRKEQILEQAREYLRESDIALEISLSREETRFGSYIISARYDHATSNQVQKASHLCNWAENALYSKNYDRAIQLAESAYQIFYSIFGYDEPDTHTTLRILAAAHSKKGEIDIASSIFKKLLHSRQRVWGLHNKFYWSYLEIYADILYENNRVKESLSQLLMIQNLMKNAEDSSPIFTEIIQKKILKIQSELLG